MGYLLIRKEHKGIKNGLYLDVDDDLLPGKILHKIKFTNLYTWDLCTLLYQ